MNERRFQLEDQITSADVGLKAVHTALTQAALKGSMSSDKKRVCASLLDGVAKHINKIPEDEK